MDSVAHVVAIGFLCLFVGVLLGIMGEDSFNFLKWRNKGTPAPIVSFSDIITAYGTPKNKHEINKALTEVYVEIARAKEKYPKNFNSRHEGFSIMKEEVDELWDEVKKKDFDNDAHRMEAVQTAAMAVRYISELTY